MCSAATLCARSRLGAGAFATPAAIAGTLIPFNVQDIGGTVYVTYAPVGLANLRGATAGMGALGVVDESGNLYPVDQWEPACCARGVWRLASANFGQFSNDLLVGEFQLCCQRD